MNNHILLTLATRRPYRSTPQLPSRATYSVTHGYWILDGEVLVNSSVFSKKTTMSKKADQEIGEDVKVQ